MQQLFIKENRAFFTPRSVIQKNSLSAGQHPLSSLAS